MNLNRVELIGRVTKNPELKKLPSGTSVVKFGLATNNIYKDKDGAKQETTAFHNCVAFGKIAETIGQYVIKGQEIYIDGRIEYRQWEKDGEKKYMTEIMINTFQFGQKPNSVGAENGRKEEVEDVADDDINPEDIPF